MRRKKYFWIALLLFAAVSSNFGYMQEYKNGQNKNYLSIPNDTVGCFNYEAYLSYAKTYADTLIRAAVDRYGRFPTPMFLQMLTLDTHEPVTKKDAPDWQNRFTADDFMRGAMGSNLYRDIHNIKTLYELTEITGNQKYKDAADAYLKSFLIHNVSPYTGLFAWGEHMYWDVFLDTVVAQRHELEIPLPPWEILWELNSTKVKNEIDAIYKIHIYDKKTFWYDRHGNWYTGVPDEPAVRGTWIKHSGLYAYSFAFMYVKTHDPKYLTWLHGIAGVFWKFRNKKTGLVRSEGQGGNTADQMQLLAFYLVKAYQLCHQKFLLDYAADYMRAFAKYTYDPANGKFFSGAYVEIGTPANEGYQRVWDSYGEAAYTGHTLALLYELKHDKFFLNYAERIAKYFNYTPLEPSASPENFGRGIRLFLDLYDATGNGKYLQEARKFSNLALTKLFKNDLIKESVEGYIYNADSDPGLLAMQLIRLYKTETKVPVHWEAPLEWSSPSEPVVVKAKFSDKTSPKNVSLGYNFSDGSSGKVLGKKNSNGVYSFTIDEPNSNYEGDLSFYITWETKGKNKDSRSSVGEGIVKINRDVNGPEFSDWSFPQMSSNTESIPVKVRVEDSFGIKQVSLHYRFSDGREGTLVYTDTLKNGNEAAWEIPAPGKCFLGETDFWVDAWGNPDNPVEKISDEKIVRASLISDEKFSIAAEKEQQLKFQDLGVDIAIKTDKTLNDASLEVEQLPVNPVSSVNGLPTEYDTAFTAKRFFSIEGSPEISSLGHAVISIPYDALQAERLVVSEISIYSWNGSSWTKLKSSVDENTHTVSAVVNHFGKFAVDGNARLKWRRTFNGAMQIQPVVVDLYGNGKLEIITNSGESDHSIYAMDSKGNIIWSYSLTSAAGFDFPEVADVDGDGKPEIVAGADDGVLYVLSNEGKLKWSFRSPNGVLMVRGGKVGMSTAVGDLFGNGKLEIVAASGNGYVYAFDGKGNKLWETKTSSGRSIPALADLYNTGKLDVIVGSGDEDTVWVLDSYGHPLWKLKANGYVSYGIAVGDMNNDGHKEILFNARRNQIAKVWCLTADGKPLWTYPCDGNGDWSVTLADMNNDSKLEAIINNVDQHELTLLNGEGKRIRGIPIETRSTVTPAVLDLNGDGKLDLIISGNDDRHVHAIDNSGKELWNFVPISPILGGAKVKGGGTPVVADIDGTGRLDVLFGDDETWFYAIRTGTQCKPYVIAVNNYNGNIQHTGVYLSSKQFEHKVGAR